MRLNWPRRRQVMPGFLPVPAAVVLGLAFWAGSPTPVGRQDMASLVSGSDRAASWTAVIRQSVAGSVHRAEMPFTDEFVTGSIAGAGMHADGLGDVAFVGKAGAAATPDEARVNRGGKQGRVAKVLPVAPPKAFNAGSIFERTSSLLRRGLDGEAPMVFARAAIKGREVEIASAFHLRQDRPEDDNPEVLLASIVRGDPAGQLLGYAAGPDFAAESPFAALLGAEQEPKASLMRPGEHGWMANSLPATVFSEREQRCLAAGIYFESRGEPELGQAAVGQVILNRVRNPSYPNSICGVVYQNEKWRNACQFSFACDGIKDRVASPDHWRTAERIALAVTKGVIFISEVGDSTHYHATYVKPRWARSMERMKKIGQHIFYRTHGGGWS